MCQNKDRLQHGDSELVLPLLRYIHEEELHSNDREVTEAGLLEGNYQPVLYCEHAATAVRPRGR